MSVLVICAGCGRLVRAESRGAHTDFEIRSRNPRAQAWYPVPHPRLGDDTGGEPCPGVGAAH